MRCRRGPCGCRSCPRSPRSPKEHASTTAVRWRQAMRWCAERPGVWRDADRERWTWGRSSMADSGPGAPSTYHVVLIGVDAYPDGYTSLSGCVNDIDALEALLLNESRTGVAPERVRITRFAAPHEGAT